MQESIISILQLVSHPLLTAGLGVHRTLFKSFAFSLLEPFPSQFAVRPIASALLAPAIVPLVVRSSSLLAAGVNAPAASLFFGVIPPADGVQLGGGMLDLVLLPGVLNPKPDEAPPPFIIAALARKLLDALLESR